jgi:hypothetical protein
MTKVQIMALCPLGPPQENLSLLIHPEAWADMAAWLRGRR